MKQNLLKCFDTYECLQVKINLELKTEQIFLQFNSQACFKDIMDLVHPYARCFSNYQLTISTSNIKIADIGKERKLVV